MRPLPLIDELVEVHSCPCHLFCPDTDPSRALETWGFLTASCPCHWAVLLGCVWYVMPGLLELCLGCPWRLFWSPFLQYQRGSYWCQLPPCCLQLTVTRFLLIRVAVWSVPFPPFFFPFLWEWLGLFLLGLSCPVDIAISCSHCHLRHYWEQVGPSILFRPSGLRTLQQEHLCLPSTPV